MRLVLVALFLLFQAPAQQDESGPCGPIPEHGVHECHCAHMISDFQRQYQAECARKPTKKEQEACLNSRPPVCTVMDHPGAYGMENHPDQCLRKCVPNRCTCNEGACGRPAGDKRKSKNS